MADTISLLTNDLLIPQGTNYTVIINVFEDQAKTVPFDLSGATAAMMVRADFDKTVPMLSLTSPVDIQIAFGALVVNFTPAMTSALKATKGEDTIDGVYDIEVTEGGRVTRVAQGAISFAREVTR